jgi:uncharacterized repeat protein (TIGR03803 family)
MLFARVRSVMFRSLKVFARACPLCVFCLSLVLLTTFGPVRAGAQSIYEGTLYSFGGSGDGINPNSGLVVDSQGNLYGVTNLGGAYGKGTVFELVNNSGNYSEQILYSFSGVDGANPAAGLIMDSHGNLFGTTAAGGGTATAGNGGTVFELVYQSPGNYSEQILHIFGGQIAVQGSDGFTPQAGVIMDSSGNLYGTTYGSAGACQATSQARTGGCGTVFELVNSGPAGYSYKVLYDFSALSLADGRNPSGLIMDSSGNLYGTTLLGGASGKGTVFELAKDGSGNYSETILYNFLSSGGDGNDPRAGLIMDSSGNLYGTTYQGGAGRGHRLRAFPSRRQRLYREHPLQLLEHPVWRRRSGKRPDPG